MTQNKDVLDRLEKLCEQATPGEWRAQMWRGPIEWPDGYRMTVMGHGPLHPETEVTRAIADMEFIAASNPATVKSLIACAKAAQALHSKVGDGDNGPPLWCDEEWYALDQAIARLEEL